LSLRAAVTSCAALAARGGSIDQLLADMDTPAEHDSADDSAQGLLLPTTSLSNSSTRSSSTPQPEGFRHSHQANAGQTKQAWRNIDGTLQPYLRCPRISQTMVTRLRESCDPGYF
jgi:hypothetical protein